jgi:iron complex outermembrane receptor protein
MSTKHKFLLTVSALTLALPVAAQAQPSSAVDEILITARKRTERLQDVPMSVAAFTAADLERAGVENVEDIARMTPGFVFAPLFGGDQSTPVIRGLSTTIGEPNVGFFIDGVYQGSRAAMEAFLGDNIERIEVAKGPQSALYGRNTFGGAINFITKRPSEDVSGHLEITGGDYDTFEASGSLSGPLISGKLFGRVGVSYKERGGYYKNELTGEDLDDRQTAVYSGTLYATPSDNLSITARVAYENTDDGDEPLRFAPNNARVANPAAPNPLPERPQLFAGPAPSYRDGYAVTPGFLKRDNLTTSLSIEWEIDGYTISSITGYNDLEIKRDQDNDYEARSIRYIQTRIDMEEFSQELRLTSPTDQMVEWMVGLYYYDLNNHTNNRDLRAGLGLDIPTVAPFSNVFNTGLIGDIQEDTENFAIFASANIEVLPRLTLGLSGRYSWEKKKVFVEDTIAILDVMGTYENEETFETFTPRISLDYKVTDDAMLYASVAKAVKSGGFNVVTVGAPILPEDRAYDPERSWHYEIGAKTSWFDNRLNFNVSGFIIKWKDQIVRAVAQNLALLNLNAGKTTSQGFELELSARPVDGLTLTGGLAYTEAEYDDYYFATLTSLGFTQEEAQLRGTQLQYVPKVTFNASAEYRVPVIADYDWFIYGDVSYQDKQSIIQPGDAYLDDRTLVNLRTGFESDHYSLTFFVNNVFKNKTPTSGVFTTNFASRYDTAAGLAGMGPFVGMEAFGGLIGGPVPRVWGITARARF